MLFWGGIMFDIKQIRENPEGFDAGLRRRGLAPEAKELIALDMARREAVSEAQRIQTERNRLSREIGVRKRQGEQLDDLLAAVFSAKAEQTDADARAEAAENALRERLASIPNLPAPDVPDGLDESANVEISRWGEPRRFDFAAKEHFEIGEALGLMDFSRGAKLSGARFVVLTGLLARLERALASFMLDLHTREFGYTEVSPPALVRYHVLFGTGNLPKFGDDLFRTTDDYWLIPTAEVPLTNLVAGEILEDADLPIRTTAVTWCFRAEAGAAGRDTRGMIRQHQFTKVELVSISRPEESDREHLRMTACAEEVLRRLDLPYRVVLLCAGDMGFAARKTFDIEVWLPGQDRYREISSCSNCGDFQARRMNSRYRRRMEKGTQFVHTLNGSGLAVGRTLVAVLENYQRPDGSVKIPEVLRPYTGGANVITANGA
jgi:seryl-tRNA synthetase